ncbi:MAG: hypothetical protein ACRELE_10300, partial [Gemmatimonadales bacterium]
MLLVIQPSAQAPSVCVRSNAAICPGAVGAGIKPTAVVIALRLSRNASAETEVESFPGSFVALSPVN